MARVTQVQFASDSTYADAHVLTVQWDAGTVQVGAATGLLITDMDELATAIGELASQAVDDGVLDTQKKTAGGLIVEFRLSPTTPGAKEIKVGANGWWSEAKALDLVEALSLAGLIP